MSNRYTGHDTSMSTASGFSAKLINITPPGQTGDAIDMTHLETENVMDFDPPDLPDPGEMSIQGYFDPNVTPPVVGAAKEEIKIQFPQAGKEWVFDGFWTAYEPGEAATNSRMEFSGTIKCASQITIQDYST